MYSIRDTRGLTKTLPAHVSPEPKVPTNASTAVGGFTEDDGAGRSKVWPSER